MCDMMYHPKVVIHHLIQDSLKLKNRLANVQICYSYYLDQIRNSKQVDAYLLDKVDKHLC